MQYRGYTGSFSEENGVFHGKCHVASGSEISRTTVRRILKADGIEPAPQRLKHMPWGRS